MVFEIFNEAGAQMTDRADQAGEAATPATSFHVAFCVDNHYFRSMGATIASILAHNPGRHFTFHVFAFTFSPDQQRRLTLLEVDERVAVCAHPIDVSLFREFASMISSSYYSLSTFSRLVIPSVLASVTDRVLYLDADILCVGRVDALVETDISDTIALVVPDVGWKTDGRSDGRYSVLQLANPAYFNAGVIYINIPMWESAQISEAAIDVLLSRGKALTFNDQDALNIVLDGLVRYGAVKWNYIYSMIADLKRGKLTMDPVGDAVFIHFAGAIKPWNDWSGHAARALFVRYHASSGWSDMPLDAVPLNYKEMRICSRSLIKRGHLLRGMGWYLKYLITSAARKYRTRS